MFKPVVQVYKNNISFHQTIDIHIELPLLHLYALPGQLQLQRHRHLGQLLLIAQPLRL
jgi:hypothetical protein